MKFVMIVEENGYQVRYWDEIQDEIGEVLYESWNEKDLYNGLATQGFHIERDDVKRAIKKIEDGKSFILLKSEKKGDVDLDTFMNDQFVLVEDDTET